MRKVADAWQVVLPGCSLKIGKSEMKATLHGGALKRKLKKESTVAKTGQTVRGLKKVILILKVAVEVEVENYFKKTCF